MTREHALRTLLVRHLKPHGEPSDEDVAAAVDHVQRRMQQRSLSSALRAQIQKTQSQSAVSRRVSWVPAVSAAALMIAAVGAAIVWPRGDSALYRIVGGSARTGDTIQSNGVGAQLALVDGSRVEMRAQSELSLERADDGVRIRLMTGGIIVHAAKQRSGHLYVQTRDMTVSVVGTVFLVNASEDGSRVAVIEGEVRVQQSGTAKQLLPGEQVSTNPRMETRDVQDVIAWSRNSAALLALLQQSAVVPPALWPQVASEPRETFEVASIKENNSGKVESFAYPYADSGRLRLVNHTARQMIRQAFGVRDYQLTGGPDWLDTIRFDIEAKAVGPTTRTGLMSMLRSLLEGAFQLKARMDSREGAVLHLVLAKPGQLGPSLTPATPQDARLNPVGAQPAGMRGSAATMVDVAATLSNLQDRLVIDKTGVSGIYNFTMTYGGERRRLPPGVPVDALPPEPEGLPALPTALSEQLGLRLESARGQIPIVVIERVERPSVDGYSSSAEPIQGAPRVK